MTENLISTDSGFLSPLFKLFGQFLMWLYEFGGSYVLALILFTLVIKLVMFPLSIKSKKSMMQTQALQGQMQKLQAQYGKDKNRYNEEVTKLYQKEGINPMGGCLWSLLPLPILFGVYAVVRRPLFFMYGLTATELEAINGVLRNMGMDFGSKAAYAEMTVAGMLNTDPAFLQTIKAALGEAATKLDVLIDFKFLGIDLAATPTLKFWQNGWGWDSIGLFLIPVLVAVFSIFSSWITQRTNAYTREPNAQMDRTSKQMMIMMPIMYIWFGFIMPAAMCIYMMANALLTTLSEVIASRMLRKKFLEMKAQREEQEAREKEEEKRRKAEKFAKKQQEEAEAKERRKKAAAIAAAGGSVASEKKKEQKDSANNAGAIGIRKYARGRSYEANRYGGVTAYKDPSVVDEAAVEAALAKKNRKKKDEE